MSSCSYLRVPYLLEVLLLKDACTLPALTCRTGEMMLCSVGVNQHQKLLATALALWAVCLGSSREG